MKKLLTIFMFFFFILNVYSQPFNVPIEGVVAFRIPQGFSTPTPMPEVGIDITNLSNGATCNTATILDGSYSCDIPLDLGLNKVRAEPSFDFNIVEGVTALDVLTISGHISALENPNNPLFKLIDDPYHRIAADVNRNKEIDFFDQMNVQFVILGVDQTFLMVESYQFIPFLLFFNPAFQNAFFNMSDPYAPFNIVPGDGLSLGYPAFMSTNTPLLLNFNVATDIDGNVIVPTMFDPSFWSFSGLKSGDVNGSSLYNSLTNNAVETRALETINLKVEDKKIQEGEIVRIPIEAKNFTQIIAYQNGIFVSPEHFELIEIEQGDLDDFSMDNFGLKDINQGHIKTLWYDKSGKSKTLKNGEVLFYLKLKAKKDIESLNGLVELDNEILDNIYYNSKEEALNVKLDVEKNKVNSTNKEVSVIPNPIQSYTIFNFELDTPSEITIQLMDTSGKILRTYTRLFDKGEQQYKIEDMNDLPKGVIFYTLEGNDFLNNGKLIKIE